MSAYTLEAALSSKEMLPVEIITVIFGKDVTENEMASLIDELEETYPFIEVFQINGGQEVYSFIIAVE